MVTLFLNVFLGVCVCIFVSQYTIICIWIEFKNITLKFEFWELKNDKWNEKWKMKYEKWKMKNAHMILIMIELKNRKLSLIENEYYYKTYE